VGSYELPPGEKWRQYELRALGLRDFARVRDDGQLNPFSLARLANLLVLDFGQVRGLTKEARDHLLMAASEEWSGGACSRPLPDGRRIVILNPNHGPRRTNATLMEEICHVFLGHKPDRLAVITQHKRTQTVSRDYKKADEEAAYAIGAAALVPFATLRKFVLIGKSAADIAEHFKVSRQLIVYRLKVTHLWTAYKTANPQDFQPFRLSATSRSAGNPID
jgi:uncharacterized protein DUF955